MVALATVVSWTPEDDLLLKNAVEAGASLESLAKGAVQFSRRFTIKEIQDRWYSLLYDPVISEEASACMNNVELSALPLPSKLSKFGHSKERKVAPVKRKAESVRSSYYAMRKRILNDTINSMNLSFPMEPENNNNEGGEVELFPEGAALNHFGFEGSNFDHLHCPFPESLMDGNLGANEVPTHAFYTGAENPVEEDFSIEQKNILEGETQMLGDHMPFNGGVEEFPCPKEVPIDSLMGDDSLSALPLSTFHQINSDPGNLCSGFDGSHVFNSPDLGCETSFNTLQLPPIPELSIWREDEGIQEADVPYDAVKDSTDSGEAYLAELSNSLLNFTNEEELYLMDVDGKDDFDKTYYDGLSSLLLNSSNDVCPDEMPTITQTDTPVASDSQVKDPPVPCHVEVDNIVLRSSDVEVVPQSEIKLPSYASARDPRYPELINGVICCVLNTEDPEIPSNEDVFLPFDAPPSIVPSSIKWTAREGNTPISSSGDGFGRQHRTAGGGTIMKQVELNTPGESHLSSQLVGSPPFPGPVGGSKVKRDLPNSHAPWTTSRSAGMDSSGPREIHSANTGVDAVVHSNSKEGAANIGLAKNLGINLSDPSNEKASHLSNSFRVLPHSNASSIKNEQDMAKPIKDKKLPHEEAGTSVVESKMVADPPTSDREEQYIESDDDVPYYSDVEAMILDMDLDPDDQDLCYSDEVLRYHHEDAKRSIIRLEQSAHSHIQRAISSHGAFAILCGRHSRHYIKKPEVILGRSTEDVLVDIDLSKGTNANKISRRQAIIKMDKVGSFHLKNLGKSSILVNNKEVHLGQSQQLTSSCLIEVRGVPFIFETNQSHVKQYLDGNGNTEVNQTL